MSYPTLREIADMVIQHCCDDASQAEGMLAANSLIWTWFLRYERLSAQDLHTLADMCSGVTVPQLRTTVEFLARTRPRTINRWGRGSTWRKVPDAQTAIQSAPEVVARGEAIAGYVTRQAARPVMRRRRTTLRDVCRRFSLTIREALYVIGLMPERCIVMDILLQRRPLCLIW
jgi:hypothetical protein